jgi:hypothetical protein
MNTVAPIRPFDVGDHACAIYSSRAQLVRLASQFLADGLARYEHTWYIGARRESRAISAALRRRGVDVDRAIHLGAFRFVLPEDLYLVDGEFRPEHTDHLFNDAITQSTTDGFRGLRAAVEMSWALTMPDAAERITAYEAHARGGFAAARVTGLCLYPRRSAPLEMLHGALLTHPLTAASRGQTIANPFYDGEAAALPPNHHEVPSKLRSLLRLVRRTALRR